ncbi:MAG: patatin-like phospholipase family protein [Alphaproteobacteria bacterium]|nr:patatin-like phospholipase family protein [Alphaproteobacteria bacterium]MCD8520641.1 patatin-like phospholipase family protein [Alphaproteobacteria bacterium]MCD8563176.1 patatin-like phospholipase family protein [Alphaproteobacteria bacterium]
MAKPQKTKIVLYVYGGGMRGIVAAHILQRLEETTGLAMADMVDIFTGPSTGSILNAALTTPATNYPAWHPSARPRFKAKHMVRFYEREGQKIFPPDRFRAFRGFIHDFNNRTIKLGQLNSLFKHGHYNPAHLRDALQRLYGETNLNETLRSLVIPVYNIDNVHQNHLPEEEEMYDSSGAAVPRLKAHMSEGGHALWLKRIEGSTKPEANANVRLYDAVLGSCAAPTYFPCHHFQVKFPGTPAPVECSGIDGSIFANPCITWHGAVRHHIKPGERVVMILVGTGFSARSFKKEDWNRFGGLGVVDPRNDLPLINILFQAPESALMEGFAEDMGENLFVFNKSLHAERGGPDTPSIQIDDASPENLEKMKRFADSILEENQARFDKLCHLLVQNRDQGQGEKENLLKRIQKRVFYPVLSRVQ